METVVPALPRAVIINISSPNISSIRKTLLWYLEWEIIASPFGRVVDSLELFIDEVATRSGHQSAVATEGLDSPVLAHGVKYFYCIMSGSLCFGSWSQA
jgi:hypothetical protein